MKFPKLKPGDEIRVIAPSRSKAIISEETAELATKRLEELGFKVSFGKHVEESNRFMSSSVESRVEDIHEAFNDPNVKGIITVIGGFNANQVLPHLDYELIAANPKPLIGYSDITVLGAAIQAKTGIPYFYGPHWSSFGMKKGLEFSIEYFKKALMEEGEFELRASTEWSNDAWYLDQENREFVSNPGYKVVQEGTAEGEIQGGNLDTFNLLNGTEYSPNLEDKIFFIEDDEGTNPLIWDRHLVSLIQQPGFKPKAIVVGRFEKKSKITDEDLAAIFDKPELKGIPIITGVDFGHTSPTATIPIGGYARIEASAEGVKIYLQ